MTHSSTLGFSPGLPVSVCGTGCSILNANEVFLGSSHCIYPLTRGLAVLSLTCSFYGFAYRNLCAFSFNVLFHQDAYNLTLRHPMLHKAGTGILTSLSSDTPFGFSLAPD
jgi:hypothetical protein